MSLKRGTCRKLAIFLTSLPVLLVVVGIWMSPRIPSHEGKDVYYWMFQTKSSGLEDNPGLSAIGANAVPYLAHALAMQSCPYDRHAWLRHRSVQAVLDWIAPNAITWRNPAGRMRNQAAISLLAFSFEAKPALPELHAALTDPSLADHTRQTVVHALRAIGPQQESLPYLLAAWPMVTNTPWSMATRCDLVGSIGALARFDPARSLPLLQFELGSTNADLQRSAVFALRHLGHAAHVAASALELLLNSTNQSLQFAASVVLGQVTNHPPSNPARLRELLHGTNAPGAAGAALTLWRWGEPAEPSVGVLVSLLSHPETKLHAAEYLGIMGREAESAVPALLEGCQRDIGAWVDQNDRAECALSLIRIAGTNEIAFRELEKSLAFPSNPWVRGAVADRLGRLGIRAAPLLPALRRNLDDADRDARHCAENALSRIETALKNAP